MPPVGIVFLDSGSSVIATSVVRSMAAADAAFWTALRVTLTGSMMTALIRSGSKSFFKLFFVKLIFFMGKLLLKGTETSLDGRFLALAADDDGGILASHHFLGPAEHRELGFF